MKTLILIRHAKSSWKDPTLDDHDRPLNKRGLRDAPTMGRRLDAHLRTQTINGPDVWLSSSAERALATSRLISMELTLDTPPIEPTPALYSFDPIELLRVVRHLDARHQQVWIVGHNPAIADLAERLTGTALPKVPTCALLQIQLDAPTWREIEQHDAELLWFDYPNRPTA